MSAPTTSQCFRKLYIAREDTSCTLRRELELRAILEKSTNVILCEMAVFAKLMKPIIGENKAIIS